MKLSLHAIRFTLYASRFTKLPSTSVENPLQIDPFMQNKPNLLNAQMNVTSIITKDYENVRLCRRGENKPNTNPIKPNQSQNKPNMNPKQTQSNPIFLPNLLFPVTITTNGIWRKAGKGRTSVLGKT